MSESGFSIPPHRVLLDNLTPCVAAGVYQNNTIYCVTTTKELPGYKTLPENDFLTTKDGLIISYRAPEKNAPQNPIVVTKAPFYLSISDVELYAVDNEHLAVYGTYDGFFLLNLNTGKINRFQTFTTTNIFNNTRKGTVPVPYKGVQ